MVSQTYDNGTEPRLITCLSDNAERAFTILLDIEVALRIAALGAEWSSYFASGRNCFDTFLAVVTTVIIIPVVQDTEVYRWLTAFALARWYRIILAIPPLRPLIVSRPRESILSARPDFSLFRSMFSVISMRSSVLSHSFC